MSSSFISVHPRFSWFPALLHQSIEDRLLRGILSSREFGMPLDGDEPRMALVSEGFDGAVGSAGDGCQAVARLVHGLMMP